MVVIIVGPSGSGKTTLERRLERLGAKRLISCTTRPPRPGEVEGSDYRFLKKEKFEAWMRLGKFVEWARFHGHYYGLTKEEIRADAAVKVVVAEPYGAAQIAGWCRKKGIGVRIVWTGAIPQRERVAAMAQRGQGAEEIEERLKNDDILERWAESGLTADYEVDRFLNLDLLALDVWRAFGCDRLASAAA